MGQLTKILDIGAMRERITIEQLAGTRDTFGGEVQTWAPLHENVPAKVEYPQGFTEEDISAMQPTAFRRILFTIRWITGLTPKLRVVYDSCTYDIIGIAPLGPKRFAVLTCELRI